MERNAIYKKYFKNSLITTNKGCLGSDTEFIKLYYAPNASYARYNILDNDMFNIMFTLQRKGDNYILSTDNNYITIKSDDKYLFCKYRKVTFRKTTGSYDKIMESFERFIQRLRAAVDEEYNNNNLLEEDMRLYERVESVK